MQDAVLNTIIPVDVGKMLDVRLLDRARDARMMFLKITVRE